MSADRRHRCREERKDHDRRSRGLFSGIGGLELGLERAGMRVVWQSEIDPYASRVLAKHWPTVPNLGDVTAIDWSTVDRPDLVCGGFPCQPFTYAGARRRQPDDRRPLWPHIAACLRLVRPQWVLLENVPGILALGFRRGCRRPGRPRVRARMGVHTSGGRWCPAPPIQGIRCGPHRTE